MSLLLFSKCGHRRKTQVCLYSECSVLMMRGELQAGPWRLYLATDHCYSQFLGLWKYVSSTCCHCHGLSCSALSSPLWQTETLWTHGPKSFLLCFLQVFCPTGEKELTNLSNPDLHFHHGLSILGFLVSTSVAEAWWETLVIAERSSLLVEELGVWGPRCSYTDLTHPSVWTTLIGCQWSLSSCPFVSASH